MKTNINTDLIYLDNNSTTKIDNRVLEEMMPFLKGEYANASSTHEFGVRINDSVKLARNRVANIIKAVPEEIIFTSGSTEAINLALKGIRNIKKPKGNHIITVCTEHTAMLDCCKYLSKNGYEITYLPVKPNGIIDIDILKNAVKKETILISVMMVNNETGVIQPIKEISEIAHEAGAIFFTDATQAAGRILIDVNNLGVDILSMSSHKLYGPKGVGALYVRSRKIIPFNLDTLIHGGGHERGYRSGTLNVAGIVGFGKACEICENDLSKDIKRIKSLRDKLESSLLKIDNTFLNGDKINRLYNISNICFVGVDSEAMIIGLKNIAVSNGSACTSTSIYPSHVLKSIGLSDKDAFSSIRFSLGRFNTQKDIDISIKEVIRVVNKLRQF